jgi:hypothetical protein
VYSLYNVGGHQPWHSPVFFFSTKRKKIYSLDQALNDSIAFDQPPSSYLRPTKSLSICTSRRRRRQLPSLH